MEERLTASGGELLAAIDAGVATVTLHRPAALNALSFGMIEGLAHWLEAWKDDDRVRAVVLRGAGDKAFCAGGDIRALYANRTQPEANHRFMAVEYALDHAIHTYPKPVTALIDGIVMGGGMGLAQGAAARLVGSRTRMAMPETAIGLFPDVGGSYFLSRTPGRIGVYLGLAGPTIGAADALYAGLATGVVDGQARDQLPAGVLEPLRPAIDRHFGAESVAAIVASLRAERAPELAEWARETLAALERSSPTMLAVTFEQLRRGATLSPAECFRMELGLVHRAFEHGDVFEGIRARLIDKDNAPRWSPPRLEEVTPAAIEHFFAPPWPQAHHPLAHLRP